MDADEPRGVLVWAPSAALQQMRETERGRGEVMEKESETQRQGERKSKQEGKG